MDKVSLPGNILRTLLNHKIEPHVISLILTAARIRICRYLRGGDRSEKVFCPALTPRPKEPEAFRLCHLEFAATRALTVESTVCALKTDAIGG